MLNMQIQKQGQLPKRSQFCDVSVADLSFYCILYAVVKYSSSHQIQKPSPIDEGNALFKFKFQYFINITYHIFVLYLGFFRPMDFRKEINTSVFCALFCAL